ncbi:RraA family protein [Limnohabitans sp.]|uniref:RraA family protein n=1 Tax=Limnohabitans sp. TaxID=1907725 RepID=UPI0037BF7764
MATISDVLGPGHVMHSSVRALRPGMRLLGAAYTLKLPPADNLGMHVAVREAKVGDVIVAEQSGGALGAPVGEIMAMAAMHKGLAGIVLNGAVRDAEKLRTEPWPVFATCIYAQQCRKDGPAWLQTTIDCAGVTVHPGDLIVGDDDGVVVVPFSSVATVAQEVVKKMEKESLRIASIAQGFISPAWLDAAIERAGLVLSVNQ